MKPERTCITCGRPLNPGARRQCGDCFEKTKRLPVCHCIDCGKQLNHRAHSIGTKRCGACARKMQIGRPGTFTGLKHSEEARRKIREKALARGGRPRPDLIGKHLPESTKAKMRLSHLGIHAGAKNPYWKGGISTQTNLIRNSDEYRRWRELVFRADNFTCCHCGSRGNKIVAHHILPFATYPELRFNRNNGATLCLPCHKAFHREARREA